MPKKKKKQVITSILMGMMIGIIVAFVNPGVKPMTGFLTGTLLSGLCIFFLLYLLDKFQTNRQIRAAAYVAFFLRLLLGIVLFLTLPAFGYDEPYNNNGYLYLDAYRRDSDAWQLAQSGAPIATAFQNEFSTDQYGGLLSLSAIIYRYFSPDAHRPLLMLIITSFFSALGIPFLWDGIRRRWDEKTANISVWILALYPESIILGASQMREPILIGLSAIAFWGVTAWNSHRKQSLLSIGLSLLLMVGISSKAAAAIGVTIIIWLWIDNSVDTAKDSVKVITWMVLGALLIGGVFLGWSWLRDSSRYDLYLMESASGRIQWELELIGERFRVPFIVSYGLAQPVLPAAIVYPGLPITRAVAIFRATGWYLLVPLMLSGFILIWKKTESTKRRVLLFFFLIIAIWTIVSSARAGGDQWDNPRYRSIFLVWMAFTAAWGFIRTLKHHSFWLWRLLLLEVIYMGFFIQWYLSRYYDLFKRMDFWPMIQLLLIIGAVIIFGGFIFDLILNRSRQEDL